MTIEEVDEHEARGREEPFARVRPRESNVIVALRPDDRLRDEAKLKRLVLTVGRIFRGLV